MKGSPSDAFKKYIVNLLKDENITKEEIRDEAKELKGHWCFYHQGVNSALRTTPLL
ncbi:MAG: hypothetical protein KDK60_04460 [Chlamydiia bacterium]|nr:hypothetical protein [Chlamydiia bacterium]